MAHDPEKWRRLLSEFQDGYARHGEALFALYAVAWEERGDAFTPGESWAQPGHQVGSVPFGKESGLCWCVVSLRPGEGNSPLAEIEQAWIDSEIPLVERSEEAREDFEVLAAKCGASLPVSIRKTIPIEPHGAISWWLTCMFFASPPAEEEIISEERRYRVFWSCPFHDAIKTIERLKLTEGNPRFWWVTDDGVDEEETNPTVDGNAPKGKPVQQSKKRGRKQEYATKKDQQIADAWNNGCGKYSSLYDVAVAFDIKHSDVVKTLARVRSRRTRTQSKRKK